MVSVKVIRRYGMGRHCTGKEVSACMQLCMYRGVQG